MNIDERIAQAEADIKAIEKNIEDLKKMKSEIVVPDDIVFERKISGLGHGLSLSFGDSRRLMWVDGAIAVYHGYFVDRIVKPKLVKCSHNDIEVGKWYFVSDDENPCKDELSYKNQYSLAVDRDKRQYILQNKFVGFSLFSMWDYIWKVTL